MANGKRRKQTIFSSKYWDSNVRGTKDLILATNYYKALFGPGEGNAFEISPCLWQEDENVSASENEELVKPFLEDEIKRALFETEKNKAADPDRLPIDFFQHYWEVIKSDMLALFNEFYLGNLDIKRINYGIITLLPKVKDAKKDPAI
jgi:hypothetical protein